MKNYSPTGVPVSILYTKKILLRRVLIALVGTLAIYGCNQSPSSTNTSSNLTSLSVEAKAAFSAMYSNEQNFQDSEAVARSKQGFNTKALDLGIVAGIDTTLKTRLDGLASQLVANIDISADILASIGRTDSTAKTSNVVTTNNSDGSTSNTLAVEFTSKSTGKTEADKVSSTTSTNGSIKIEHYLTANAGGYNKTAVRAVNNDNNQKAVTTQSTATLSNGSTVVINETRNANNGLQGTGTISITSSNGSKSDYSFNSNVTSDGKLSIDAKNTADNMTVNCVQKTDTVATTTVTSNGNTQTSDINTDFSSESSLSAN